MLSLSSEDGRVPLLYIRTGILLLPLSFGKLVKRGLFSPPALTLAFQLINLSPSTLRDLLV